MRLSPLSGVRPADRDACRDESACPVHRPVWTSSAGPGAGREVFGDALVRPRTCSSGPRGTARGLSALNPAESAVTPADWG
jgi:hypothetical protein